MPRSRRHDPDRRARIADAAVDVIAAHGVAGLTLRRVAEAADVPLGSTTYHFADRAELLRVAFGREAERGSARYAARFADVADREGFVDAVTGVIDDATGDERGWVINYELYLAAQRDPALRDVTEAWMQADRAVLARFVDAEVARGVDGLVEGLQIHKGLSTAPVPRARTRALVAAFLHGIEVHVPEPAAAPPAATARPAAAPSAATARPAAADAARHGSVRA